MVFTDEPDKIITPHRTESNWADGGEKRTPPADDVSRAELEAPQVWQLALASTSP